MKLQLKDKVIPKRADGYPNFTHYQIKTTDGSDDLQALEFQFSDEEIVELCNRALYQLEYQKTAHAKYQQRQRELQQPVKDALKKLYPGTSWIKATEEQLREAMKLVEAPDGKESNTMQLVPKHKTTGS
jgi:hypothetical protein